MIEGRWVKSHSSLSSRGCTLMCRTWGHAEMTQHSIFMEPTAGSPGLCKIREEKWPAEQLLPVTPIAEAFFSLHFGCLASAKNLCL